MMRDSASPFPRLLKISLRFLAALTGLTMILTKELDPLFVATFVCFFGLGFATERREQLSRILGRWQPLLAFAFFLLAVLDFFYLSRSFLISVAHFLLSLQGLRLLALRSVRDGLGSTLLSSMMLLSASTLSVDWSFFVCFLAFLPLAVWCLILTTLVLDHQEAESESTENVSSAEKALVSAGLSEKFFPDERQPDWKEALPVARRSTAIAFSSAAVCCAVIFILFPRINFRGFHGQFLQPVHRTGFTNQVDLRKGASIFQDDSVALRVEMDPSDREQWNGYLRGSTLEFFDGRVWSRGGSKPPEGFYGTRGHFRLPTDPKFDGRPLRVSIYLESMDSPVLFAPPAPVQLWVDRPTLMLGADGSLERWRNDTWRIHYEVESRVPNEMSGGLNFSSSLQESGEAQFCHQLPRDFSRLTFAPLLQEWIGHLQDPLQEAARIASLLQTRYRYTLDLTQTTGDRPLEDFLLHSKKGNCEYFAAAMCILLRQSGIPARMVTGYRAHEWNDRGKYFIVRMKDAHAWVEVFARGSWHMFDPTPRDFQEGSSGPTWLRRLGQGADYLNLRWNRYVLSYDMERQLSFVEEVGVRSRGWTLSADKMLSRFSNLFVSRGDRTVSLGSMWSRKFYIAAGVVLFSTLLWFWRSRASRRSTSPWFYQRLLALLKKQGFRKMAGQTILEFVDSIRSDLGAKWEDARFVAETYHQVRFSSRPQLDPPTLTHLHSSLRRLA